MTANSPQYAFVAHHVAIFAPSRSLEDMKRQTPWDEKPIRPYNSDTTLRRSVSRKIPSASRVCVGFSQSEEQLELES